MNGLFYLLFGLAGVAVIWLALRYARPILAEGEALSSPEPMPMPGRHFSRRLKRWWRDAALRRLLPDRPGDPLMIDAADLGSRCRLRPIFDLQAGRLAGYRVHLDDESSPTKPSMPPAARDLALILRATAHGRRLGWRHSSTAVIVPVASLRNLLANPRASAWDTLERYSGDEVATVPPLIFLVDDLGALPEETIAGRLGRLRVGVGLAVDQLPEAGSLPAVVERVFVEAVTALDAPRVAQALNAAGRRVIVTGVADMAQLERLARAGLHFATGPVFGRASVVQ